jgi:signal transduction histidine kinase
VPWSAFSNQRSPRARIIALLLTTGLPVLLLAIYGLTRYVDASRRDVIDDRTAVAQAAAQAAQAAISDSASSAETLAVSLEAIDASRHDIDADLLDRARRANADWDQVALVTADHQLLAGSDQLDEPDLQALVQSTAAGRVTQVGTIPGRFAPDSSSRSIRVAVPVQRSDGSTAVLLVTPSMRGIGTQLRAVVRGGDTQVVLQDGAKRVLVGPQNLPPELLNVTVSNDSSSREVVLGGAPTLIAVAPIASLNWRVLVAQPTALALRAVYRDVSIATVALVAALLLAGLLGWYLGGKLSTSYEQLVEARDRAENAARIRDTVLASISHDLQNPITAAKGQLQLLQRRVAREPDQPASNLVNGLGQVERAVGRMQTMASELVDAARLEAGYELSLNRTPTDLVALVRREIDEQLGGNARQSIELHSTSSMLLIDVDATRLARVVANLLSNATKYSPPDSTIVVSLAANESCASITITDQGVGIPAADLPRIFERFHRASNVMGHIAGSGLGLTGALKIVQQHGGTMVLDSREGQGTTVRVELPRSIAASASRLAD